jgi:hypothetical protein
MGLRIQIKICFKFFFSFLMENSELFTLPLPPSGEFNCMRDLLNHCIEHSKSNGYAVSTKSSNPERKIVIKCDFGGTYRKIKEEIPQALGFQIVHFKYTEKKS